MDKKSIIGKRQEVHINRFANVKIKVLVTQCAGSAILYNTEMSVYLKQKVAKGKETPCPE